MQLSRQSVLRKHPQSESLLMSILEIYVTFFVQDWIENTVHNEILSKQMIILEKIIFNLTKSLKMLKYSAIALQRKKEKEFSLI